MAAVAEGFAQFVEARERALQRTAYLLTGDWALAEDLVQTALARAWPRWERIVRRDDPEIYVRKVLVNTWTTWSRRRWRGEKPSAAVPDNAAAGDVAEEVSVRLGLRGALGSLTPRQREVLQLLAEGHTMKEAAAILNVATRTVAFHKYRIMQDFGLETNSDLLRFAIKQKLVQQN